MMRDAILGIDTSNYTTSVAAVSLSGELLAESRSLLPVDIGQRGLRQSEALFHHVQRLPLRLGALMSQLGGVGGVRFHAVGVSVRPRPVATSYMPVFTAGLHFAEAMAQVLGIPVVPTSHQEGHLEAAILTLAAPPVGSFIAVHLSGGTTDVMLATPTRFGYHIELVGESADLHAGQFVDRVGVRLGLPFPAGTALEQLATTATPESSFRLPSKAMGASLSFSGPCAAAERAIAQGVTPAEIALAVQASIANGVVRALQHASTLHPGAKSAIVAGGVASNHWIRERVTHRLRIVCPRLQVSFADPLFARDNAFGVAGIAARFILS